MRRKLGASLAAVLVAAAVLMTGSATSPAAAQTTICSGVSIKEVQKCDPGWAANMHFMHWNMYRGHNCTNYVAYRLKRDGVPQPPYRLGNADTWAPNAKRHGVRVDGKPEVGAVGAWPGRRHVVYIEEVGSNYLITSEDNWPGYYPKGMYRKIKVFKGERAYPTQFIHFKGKSTINGPVPTVSGTPEVGSTLTAKIGTWSPSDVTLKYQWLRDGVIISGATMKSYTLTSKDVGHAITISVTGSKSGFASRTASSKPTDEVAPKDDEEPSSKVVESSTPTVTGTAKRGRTLTGNPGHWGPTGVALAYEWARSDGTVVATDTTTYKVRTADLGHQLVFRVTGSKKSYKSVTETSRPTDTVRATSTLIVTPEAAARGKAVLGVVVSVSNAPTPTGDVTVRKGSTKLKTNDLAIGRPGRATLRLTLPRGTHTLTVSYGGSATVAPGSTTVTVKVG